MNKEHILSELKQSRDALNNAIAYIEGDALFSEPLSSVRIKTIRIGEGRAVAILAALRDSGGKLLQREFEDICISNSRTLVGAGGFIARGSIAKKEKKSGEKEYAITDKGLDTVSKWEARHGSDWAKRLEKPDILGNTSIHDHQKIKLFV